jgi:ribosomal protein S18 acetylase RimI-like enzyme
MEIRDLHRSEIDTAAGLLSRGMCDNPNNIAAFGPDADRRQKMLTVFFRRLLQSQFARGGFLGAFDGSTLLGVCGMAAPGRCQPGFAEKLGLAWSLLLHASPAVFLRVARWGGAWARRDPVKTHWHLGPVAVDSHLRGRGVGGALMTAFCQRMDEAGSLAYLETDKPENTAFYKKHGFVLDGEDTVLGMPNWYMSRPAKPRAIIP